MWHYVRAIIMFGAIGIRVLTYRYELQFEFDKSYVLISKLMQN